MTCRGKRRVFCIGTISCCSITIEYEFCCIRKGATDYVYERRIVEKIIKAVLITDCIQN